MDASSDNADQLFSDNYDDDAFLPAEQAGVGAEAMKKKKSSLSIDAASKNEPTKKSGEGHIDLNAGFQLPEDDDNGFGNFGLGEDLFNDGALGRGKNDGSDFGEKKGPSNQSELKTSDKKPEEPRRSGASGLLDFNKLPSTLDESRRATASFGQQAPKQPVASKPAEAKKDGNRFDYLNFAKDNESASDEIRERESD